jgi:coenzyme PQQ precursor peptide PqqA
MASVRPAGGFSGLFTGYTHDFYMRRGYGRNVGRGHDRDVMSRRYHSPPLAARLACAKLVTQPLVLRPKGNAMAWTTPILIEICVGLEINGYLPAEF